MVILRNFLESTNKNSERIDLLIRPHNEASDKIHWVSIVDVIVKSISWWTTVVAVNTDMKQKVFVITFAIILDVTSVETGIKVLQKKFLLDGKNNTCDFNANTLCSWSNVYNLKAGEVSDDFDWTLYAGNTPTDDTGPSVDHTTGTDKGTYAFIESSAPRVLGEKAWMESPEIPALGQSVVCLRFWYHKYGEQMGNLSVYQHQHGPRPGNLVWSDVTEHGDRWLSAQIPLLAYVNFRIILEGVVGNGFLGDIAVDDVSVGNGYCLVTPPEASRSNVTPPPVTSVPSPVDGVWSTWSAWSACTVTCGGGAVTRHRACNYPSGAPHGQNCTGNVAEGRSCNTDICPVGAASGPMCMDCSRLPSPSDCNHVIKCAEHEVCHVTQIFSGGGHLFYDMGCQATSRCPRSIRAHNSTVTRRTNGDNETCIECCQGDYCNRQGCGSQPIPDVTIRGPICFKCDVQETIDSCETVVDCGSDNECFLSTVVTPLTNTVKYTSKCMAKGACDTLRSSGLFGRRSNACVGCCKEDFCNTDCSRAQSVVTKFTSATKASSTSTRHPTAHPTTTHLHVPSTTRATTTTIAPTTTRRLSQEQVCRKAGYSYINVTHAEIPYHYCVRVRSDVTLSWHQAQSTCKHDGGNLVVFHDKDEGKYFDRWLQSLNPVDKIGIRYWVGATDEGSEGYWTWVDGVDIPPSSYADYFWQGQPNDTGWQDEIHENCAAANYNWMQVVVALNDMPCETLSNFICEIKL
ncbi:uncharacterized protein LOC127867973 isoform X1 [Dreissena polymorpha]|uniref:uncharacterized protein LOC127867973 isoform X1 n=2 Tax=Dreissena polymorpha TaxID=45954 RepID=UPI0022645567|nr:uncharacterized protein LOC127867973 isoform X1 [Dreissena polymorpha]